MKVISISLNADVHELLSKTIYKLDLSKFNIKGLDTIEDNLMEEILLEELKESESNDLNVFIEALKTYNSENNTLNIPLEKAQSMAHACTTLRFLIVEQELDIIPIEVLEGKKEVDMSITSHPQLMAAFLTYNMLAQLQEVLIEQF